MLVVEDNTALCRAIADDLEGWFPGYRIDSAGSYEEAKSTLKKNQQSDQVTRVIVVDEVLRGRLRGSDFIAYVDKHYPRIRKIMLAARAELDDVSKALNAGRLDKYLLKNEYENNPDKLRDAVASVLDEDGGFIYEAILELLREAQKESGGRPLLIAAGKERLTPSQLLDEIAGGTTLGQNHVKAFTKVLYRVLAQPKEFLRELKRVESLRKKAKVKVPRKRTGTQVHRKRKG
jgi:CheY-like chemotaxis protein